VTVASGGPSTTQALLVHHAHGHCSPYPRPGRTIVTHEAIGAPYLSTSLSSVRFPERVRFPSVKALRVRTFPLATDLGVLAEGLPHRGPQAGTRRELAGHHRPLGA